MSEVLDVRESPSGKAIEAYCYTQAQALGLTLGYVCVESILVQTTQEPHYVVRMHIIQPFRKDDTHAPTYTRAQVEGYATGETTDTIQSDIRAALESAKQVWQTQQQL